MGLEALHVSTKKSINKKARHEEEHAVRGTIACEQRQVTKFEALLNTMAS